MPEVLAVLANYPPDCQPTPVESPVVSSVESLGSAGGMSGAQFWRITAPRGVLALRRWPAEFPPADRLNFIHAILRHAADRGLDFLPIPVTTQTGESFISHDGHLWELAPWKPGSADYEQSPTPEKLQAAMRALAEFHNAVATYTPLSVGAHAESRGTNSQSAIHRHTHRLQQLSIPAITILTHSITERTWPDLAPLAHQFVASLAQSIPPALAQLQPLLSVQFPLQPCLRDIWHDHILFTGNEVTGLIDFGAVDIDTPATDIARLLGSLSSSTLDQTQTWQAGLSAYNTIRPLSVDETRAARALHTSGNILAGCNWIRWIYIEGRQFENRAQVLERFRRIAARATA